MKKYYTCTSIYLEEACEIRHDACAFITMFTVLLKWI